MDTLEFLKAILPDEGWKVIAEFRPGKPPIHHYYKTHEEAAAKVLELDAAGRTMYHACATFVTNESRKVENAGWMKSFWVDLDVEAGNPLKYDTQKDAIADIGRVCKELQLPLPLIIKSGGGIHGYWLLETAVDAFRWRVVADRAKRVFDALAFRQDRTRTADASSVLRPAGSTWRKHGARPVECVHRGSQVSIDDFESGLGRCPVQLDPATGNVAGSVLFSGIDADDLGGSKAYAPSSAGAIVRHCATLAHVAETGGAVEEPLWRAMLGLVKHTIEGEKLAHQWSMGYDGYDSNETQAKLDGWTTGPTTCKAFRGTNGNKCAGCTLQVSSPIHLGYTVEAPPRVDVAVPAGEAGADLVPTWPRGYGWNGALTYLYQDTVDPSQNRWIPFCDTLWFPYNRVRDEEGVWNLKVKHQAKDHRWRDFDLPCELIGAQQGLASHLAAHEVFLYGKQGVTQAKDLLRNYTLSLQQQSIEQVTYTKMGWADQYRSFIIGKNRVGTDSESEILAGEQIKKAGWDRDFGCAGTAEEWTRLVDELYNRPGAEAYQFAIGCAFAAPLVELTDAGNWHGIPVAITGTTGLGKTTTCKVAASIYGYPSNFIVASGKDGATMNAMVSRIGTARNLPIIFDELTDRESEEVSSFLYMLSSGKPKDRNRADGTIIDLGLSWNTVSFITSNKNVTELLFMLDERNVTEATQIRCFEITLNPEDMTIWGDTNAIDMIEHQLLEANYGHAGRRWLRHIMEHRGQIKEEIRKLRAKYNPNSTEDTRERYYRDLIAAVVVALKHAAKVGLVKFDLVKVAKWARDNTMKLRTRRHANSFTPDEYIANFLHSLHGRTIITRQFKDGRATAETPMEQLRQAPVARMALEDKVFLVLRKALTDYAQEHRMQSSWLIDEMDKRGMIISFAGEQIRRERIGKGTNLPSTPSICIELNYDQVTGMANLLEGVPT